MSERELMTDAEAKRLGRRVHDETDCDGTCYMSVAREYHRRMVEAEKHDKPHCHKCGCLVCHPRETVEGWMKCYPGDPTGVMGHTLYKVPESVPEQYRGSLRRVTVILGEYINKPEPEPLSAPALNIVKCNAGFYHVSEPAKPTPENCPCRPQSLPHCCEGRVSDRCCVCHDWGGQLDNRADCTVCGRKAAKPLTDAEKIERALSKHEHGGDCTKWGTSCMMAAILRGEETK